MEKGVSTGVCDACDRKVPREKLKAVKEQYHGEIISRGTPGTVKNYYATVNLCSRCRLLRKISILVGVVLGGAYWVLWSFLYEVTKYVLGLILWVLFNPLVVIIFIIVIFRVLTKCDTLVKTNFHSKEHYNYMHRDRLFAPKPQYISKNNSDKGNDTNISNGLNGGKIPIDNISHDDITTHEKKQSNTTCPLLTFAKAHGKMQVGEFVNKETGESFKACIFTNPQDNTRVFVAFSAKLGELTPKEIAAMKDELVVVQLESGNYSLCKRNTNWEDVQL